MSSTYQDPCKQKSRKKQRDFIARNLLRFKKPSDVRVVCFPGAELDGEEALEIKEIYDPLGIPRQNIVGLEADSERAERLRKADLGIVVEQIMDLDFFKEIERQFDVISLDYTGYRDEAKWQSLHQIAGRQLLYRNGILCTNYSARRESKKYQAQMLTLQADSILHTKQEHEKLDNLEELIKQFQKGASLNLSDLRNDLTHRTIMIMRMGTSAIKGIELLITHPYYIRAQEKLKEFEEETKRKSRFDGFHFLNRYDSGMGEQGASHPLSYLYRKMHMECLAEFMVQKNGVTKNLASFFTHYLVDKEMKAQFPRAIERYSYNSNKNATMEMDLIAFTSAERVYRKLYGNIFYNQETGKLTEMKRISNKLLELSREIIDQKDYEIPERLYLGSS